MKTELTKALSYGNFGLQQAQTVTQRTQTVNRVHESLAKAGGSERARLADVYVQSAREAKNAEQTLHQSRNQQVKTASRQFAQVLSKENTDVNKLMATLIAPPMNGTQPQVQLGQIVDRFA
ncbi:MAG: hypothetical protein GX442_07055 [Candidatus Riflebacteria bacterium]|nr:hypothetical protein [Candidatus Riflebacteria bacterium]